MNSGTMVVMSDGSVRVIDPERSMFPFFRELDPGFEIVSSPPPSGFVPAFQRMRRGFICNLERSELQDMDTAMAWAVHNVAMQGRIPLESRGEVSLLELKVELGGRILSRCDLCGWRCGANRYESEGRCSAGSDALFNGLFEHVAEEAPINPACNLKLMGCPMKCAFCQAPENLGVDREAQPLGPQVWEQVAGSGAWNTLEFVGGEPMVSSPGILKFLAASPESFSLPIVMNCSAYLGETALHLMSGVVDVWMPDLTFGNDNCARRLSGVEHYWETATEAISLMCNQEARVMVRILVLPGHVDCCHRKALEWLSQHRDRLWISLMDQYLPLHEASMHRDINRLPREDEIRDVRHYALKMGLRDVNESPRDFWSQGSL